MGTIREITPYASVSGGISGYIWGQGTPSISLLIDFSGNTSDLIPGLSASGNIVTNTIHNALLVPGSAVFMDGTEEYLFCFVDGIARKTPVTTGLYYDGYYQIEQGITVNDWIITNPDDTLTDGMRVKAHA